MVFECTKIEPESDPTIEEDEDRFPPEIEDDESEDSDFELESSSNEEERTESENEDENNSEPTTSNKENEPANPKQAKKKAQRDAVFQQILASSNLNNRPTYENPSTKNKRTSTKKTPAIKNAECNICKIKFTKQGLTRHRNTCQATATTKKNFGMIFIDLFYF